MLNGDYILLLLLLIIVGTSKIKIKEDKTDYLSIENTTIIKGFLALTVVLCHLGLFYGEGKILNHFVFLGSISVGVFFFLSGYALMSQYLKKKDYKEGFLKRRLGKIFVPYIIVTFVYMAYFFLIGERVGFFEAIRLFLIGESIVSYSWYIAEIMVLYLIFYFSMLFFKDQKSVLVANVVISICLIIFYNVMKYPACWSDSTHMYIIGIIWAYNKDWINLYFRKIDIPTFVVSLIFLILINTRSSFFSRIAYTFLFVVFFMRFDLKNQFLTFTGKVSMEIYMLHGLAIKIVRRFFFDDDSFVSLLTVFILVYFLSAIFNRLFRYMTKRFGL